MPLTGKCILVTGGAGYVGSHFCKALAALGGQPVTYDSLVHGHEWAVKWGPLEKGDLNDMDHLRQVIRQYRPETVIHFAAYTTVAESVSNPSLYYHNNVSGTLALLEAMKEEGVGTIVFSSTCAIYGEPETIPIPESHPMRPNNPYGVSKMIIEQMLLDFGVAYGLRSASLRYFNAAGADPDGEIGEDHDPESHLIPLVLDTCLGDRPHIEIFGDDYDTPDGTCVRDYVHVSDLAEAHILALKRLADGGDSFALNLGTGKGHSVRQVIETAQKVAGRDIAIHVGPRRPGDTPMLVANVANAGKLLGWRPECSALEVQLADAWHWHQGHSTA